MIGVRRAFVELALLWESARCGKMQSQRYGLVRVVCVSPGGAERERAALRGVVRLLRQYTRGS